MYFNSAIDFLRIGLYGLYVGIELKYYFIAEE